MKGGVPGSDLAALQRDALDAFGTRFAICNTIYAAQMLHSEDMAAVLCSALNDWIAREWLDREPRLRASIVVPVQSAELAVKEIERCAKDKRFVQVLLLAMGELPLGRRAHWPIYEAAERLGLPIGVHAGSSYRHAPTPAGWPSYFVEDYVAQSLRLPEPVAQLHRRGRVRRSSRSLKVVMIEAGFTWLPPFLWRADKSWRGVRREVPWIKEPPSDVIRQHVRFTLQPLDGPPDSSIMAKRRRADRFGRGAAVLDRLPALAVRAGRGYAERIFRRTCCVRSCSTIHWPPIPGCSRSAGSDANEEKVQ